MPVSDFLPFAVSVDANVETQTEFAGDPALGPGYASGQVYSRKVNKLWRQSSFVSAAIARMIMEQLGQDVIDNGDISAFTLKLAQAITNVSGSPDNSVLIPTTGAVINVPNVSKVILNPVVSLATLTLQMPNAADKRSIRIGTRQRIDALNITALGGQTVDWATNQLPQNGMIDLTLVQSLNAWVRV